VRKTSTPINDAIKLNFRKANAVNKHDHSHETEPGYHQAEKHTKQGQHSRAKSKRGVHKDWRLWVVIGLMLLGTWLVVR